MWWDNYTSEGNDSNDVMDLSFMLTKFSTGDARKRLSKKKKLIKRPFSVHSGWKLRLNVTHGTFHPFWISLSPSCHPVSPNDLGATNGKCECGYPVVTRLTHERVTNGYLYWVTYPFVTPKSSGPVLWTLPSTLLRSVLLLTRPTYSVPSFID